jgi:hypothetical protein
MLTCPSCRSTVSEKYQFCLQCGTDLGPVTLVRHQQQQPSELFAEPVVKKSPTQAIVIAAGLLFAGVVLLVIIVAVAFLLNQTNNTAPSKVASREQANRTQSPLPPAASPIATNQPRVVAPLPAPTVAESSSLRPVLAGPPERTVVALPDGLSYVDVVRGVGQMPTRGQFVKFHFHSSVQGGKVLDDTYSRNMPVEVQVGTGALLRGLDEGLLTMTVGTKRMLVIPPSLAFGNVGRPPDIPPNATLLYAVELLSVK